MYLSSKNLGDFYFLYVNNKQKKEVFYEQPISSTNVSSVHKN